LAGPEGAPREALPDGDPEPLDVLDETVSTGDETPLSLDVVNASEIDLVGVAVTEDVELKNAGEEVEQS
jgi:hypothetical protein